MQAAVLPMSAPPGPAMATDPPAPRSAATAAAAPAAAPPSSSGTRASSKRDSAGAAPLKRERSESRGSTSDNEPKASGATPPKKKLRRGKWTPEEEAYVERIIHDFNAGLLDVPAGTTLRTYLSQKLNCDPMRITKKFTGASCIGKRVFHPRGDRNGKPKPSSEAYA